MRNLSVIKGLYQGNGVTRRWAIPFEYNDTAQIFVTVTTYDDGDYTYRVLDRTEFTIDEDSVEIVYPKSADDTPISNSQYLTVWRDTDLLQLIDLTNQGAAWPDSIEGSFDKLHQIVQELAEGLSRALKVDIGDPQTPDEKLIAIQDYVLAAAESSRSASASEASAQRSAEAAATSEANAADSERLAGGYADTATAAASRAEDSAISARAYNAPDYDNETTYQAGDVVTFTDGNSYRALQETTGNEPPNIIYWQKVTDYVGDNFFEIDEYGYIVPMDSPSHSRYWRVDQNGYIVPIEGGDGGYRPDTRSLSAEYLNVTNEGYVKHLRADDVNAGNLSATGNVTAGMVTTPQANVTTLTANAVNAGTVNAQSASVGTLTADDVIAKGPIVDVRAFGAVGDGITDDTAAIQAAIDASVNGGVVLIPTGDYKLSKAAPTSIYPNNDQPCIYVHGKNKLKIVGGGTLIVNTHAQGAIEVIDSNNIEINNLKIVGYNNFPKLDIDSGLGEKGYSYGGYYDESKGFFFENYKNNSLDTSAYIGFGNDRTEVWGTFGGGYICNVGHGILIQASSNVTVENCVIYGFNGAGIAIGARGTNAVSSIRESEYIKICKNEIYRCYIAGVIVYFGDYICVENNYIYNIGHPDALPENPDEYVYQYADPGYGVSASYASVPEESRLRTGVNVTISNNYLYNCVRKAIDSHMSKKLIISNNFAKNIYAYGIAVEGSSTGTDMCDVHIESNILENVGYRGEGIQVYYQNSPDDKESSCIVKSNILKKARNNQIDINWIDNVIVADNIFVNPITTSASMFIKACGTGMAITGNTGKTYNELNAPMYLECKKSIISNNNFVALGACQIDIYLQDDDDSMITNNNLIVPNAQNESVTRNPGIFTGNIISGHTNLNNNSDKMAICIVEIMSTAGGSSLTRSARIMGSKYLNFALNASDGFYVRFRQESQIKKAVPLSFVPFYQGGFLGIDTLAKYTSNFISDSNKKQLNIKLMKNDGTEFDLASVTSHFQLIIGLFF